MPCIYTRERKRHIDIFVFDFLTQVNFEGWLLKGLRTLQHYPCCLPLLSVRNTHVTAAMTSSAYHGYAGTHLPIAEQEVGLQEVELCI